MKTSLKVVVAACLVAVSASANAQVVDFSGDNGTQPNPFFSSGSSLVSFSTVPSPSFFRVSDFGHQSHGNGLALWNSGNPYFLTMSFVNPMSFLSVGFGNDDLCCGPVGMNVFLRIFSGSTQIGGSSVVANMNDIMDQTISWTGAAFDRAELEYGSVGLAIVVDDVTFNNNAIATPEPASLALLATGLVGIGGVVRRRRRA